ncbi:LamG domain-containing protein [Aeoliella mucimassa]|uniref:Secreted protein n=1 Tax=Aeoliella mucimassa TaxID=2527972 RepID=A0A518AW12_9BACT|nr:LamG domain-containing protein [Aeoliella mucimassa]QDU58929.1 hypothetical protein Pan181_51700 [Aeoliella mucimassa]
MFDNHRLAFAWVCLTNALAVTTFAAAPASQRERVEQVTQLSGLVAFWDFVDREPDRQRRFVAHVPEGDERYPLDAANYVRDYWQQGREATYDDFPLLGRGPFGQAVRIVKESEPDFRPFLYVPRSRLHDTPLDIKGDARSVTVVVWAIRESGNHALAGIWHEGTDLKQRETAGIAKVERGQRQYALFAGLNYSGSACGHVSENGAGSFLNKYALHKCNSAAQVPAVSADSPADVLDHSWHCLAMTLDHSTEQLTGWVDGNSDDRWLERPKRDGLIGSAYQAYMQGYYAGVPGLQQGEDPSFPADQYYNPPEDTPVATKVLSESPTERTEQREYAYTKVELTLRRNAQGAWDETDRELIALRLNPWWYPHSIYTPADDDTGGPFTIGRVIHSGRSVGFTGWIGGVAVFDRALTSTELALLAGIAKQPMVSAP